MRTIKKYTLALITDEQTFEIPGWGGVAFIGHNNESQEVAAFCHVDTDKDSYLARFKITATDGPSPSPSSEFIYVGSAVGSYGVYHVWRNAVTEKVKSNEHQAVNH